MSKGFDTDACASKGHVDVASKPTAKSTALTRSVKGVSQDSAWIKGACVHAYTRAIRTHTHSETRDGIHSPGVGSQM
jgi:hypothetical protein